MKTLMVGLLIFLLFFGCIVPRGTQQGNGTDYGKTDNDTIVPNIQNDDLPPPLPDDGSPSPATDNGHPPLPS